jgi:hypothetical protein
MLDGESNVMVGIIKGELKTTSFEDVLRKKKEFDENLIKLARTLGK